MAIQPAVTPSGNAAARPEIPDFGTIDESAADFSGLRALSECLWTNQANLIKSAADHFDAKPELIATILLPVVFQAMASAFPDKSELREMVCDAIDKGFDDWLRSVPHEGAAQ